MDGFALVWLRVVLRTSFAARRPRVFKIGLRFHGLPARAGKDELPVLQFYLRDRDGNVVTINPEEAACPDDDVRDGLVGRDDDVVDCPDDLILVVVDVLPENLTLAAPTIGHFAHLGGRDAEQR